MSPPSPRDGRTDRLHKVGSLRRPHRRTHHGTQDTRGPRACTGTHGTHGRQARHTHLRDASPATPTRTPAAVKMSVRPTLALLDGWTDRRHQRPLVTAAAHSDVAHESTHVDPDAVVKNLCHPHGTDGRTDSTRCACHRGRQDGATLTILNRA
uniref:Uncharacterized protein n=1 Tax=Mus musculus TaxID=10090 RepID=Q4KL23_MOUSE|nr:Unknown (protein for MGC:117719) [Mus musculus]